MSKVLYEMTSGYTPYYLLIAGFSAALFLVPIYLKIRAAIFVNSGREYTREQREIDSVITLCVWLFVFLAALITLTGQGDMFRSAVSAWESGEYEIVEGYVENYMFPSSRSHRSESFEINDVHFEYSSYNQVPGYHTTADQGGVITSNGQYLKIKYIYYNDTYGNIILSIEQVPPPK